MKWYIPVGVAAAGLGVFLAVRAAKAASVPKRVAVIGDSLVGGQAFMVALKAALPTGATVEIHSYPGKGTAAILDALGPVLIGRPTHVVILAGVNDLASGRGAEVVKTNLNEMHRAVESAGAKPVAVELTPWRGNVGGDKYQAETASVNGWIRSSSGAKVVRTGSLGYSNGVLKPENDSGDGLHMSADGQRALAAVIARSI